MQLCICFTIAQASIVKGGRSFILECQNFSLDLIFEIGSPLDWNIAGLIQSFRLCLMFGRHRQCTLPSSLILGNWNALTRFFATRRISDFDLNYISTTIYILIFCIGLRIIHLFPDFQSLLSINSKNLYGVIPIKVLSNLTNCCCYHGANRLMPASKIYFQ